MGAEEEVGLGLGLTTQAALGATTIGVANRALGGGKKKRRKRKRARA